LTAALLRRLEQGAIRHCIAWCHDLTWTSPNSRSKVFPHYPWDLLRTQRADTTYVTVSQERQSDLNLLMPVRVTQAKNIELALGVVSRLIKKDIQPKLVVTGPPDPHDAANMEYFQSLLALRKRLEAEEQARFVYESGPVPGEPLTIAMALVGELLRVSDLLFMPSHREGFGMPVLEAGLAGVPIFCSETVPAAKEIGGQDLVMFPPQASPDDVAALILRWMEDNPTLHLRRRVRRNLTWQGIFRHDILPLLERGTA
jgi:glycosyltransferase involved in cell wall biosynthesis